MKKWIILSVLCIALFGCVVNEDDCEDGKDGQIFDLTSLTTVEVYNEICQTDWQDIALPIDYLQIIVLEVYNLSGCYIGFYYRTNKEACRFVCIKKKETLLLIVGVGDTLQWKANNDYKQIKIDLNY